MTRHTFLRRARQRGARIVQLSLRLSGVADVRSRPDVSLVAPWNAVASAPERRRVGDDAVQASKDRRNRPSQCRWWVCRPFGGQTEILSWAGVAAGAMGFGFLVSGFVCDAAVVYLGFCWHPGLSVRGAGGLVCLCFRWHPRVAFALHASPLFGAAPTFLCRRKEK